MFAGVGGFRLGMERLGSGWETVWFSQWEPGAKNQYAHDCYVRHFGDVPDSTGEMCTGWDINLVNKENIPDHTLLVGGFPCQDYSVAKPLSSSKGIEGKKGVLWWQIRDVLKIKKPPFCIFENVDRLLTSPKGQRGRDFGIILACLNEQGYSVEWRVVNAAHYGVAQRRKRVFIFAFRNDTNYAKKLSIQEPETVLATEGLMARAFPISELGPVSESNLSVDIPEVSNHFKFNFCASGYMTGGKIFTADVTDCEEEPVLLGQILQHDVDETYYIDDTKLPRWKYLKGAKRIVRKAGTAHEYIYSEGAIVFPDPLNRPSRTILTSESSLSRTSHIVEDPITQRLRKLTPVETERLQGFDDEWTDGMPQGQRYKCMGNALAVPMITRMGRILDIILTSE